MAGKRHADARQDILTGRRISQRIRAVGRAEPVQVQDVHVLPAQLGENGRVLGIEIGYIAIRGTRCPADQDRTAGTRLLDGLVGDLL